MHDLSREILKRLVGLNLSPAREAESSLIFDPKFPILDLLLPAPLRPRPSRWSSMLHW
jgi:hypothetical protein